MGYTLNRQWYVNANSRIYFNTSTRWYLDAYLSAKHYPDLFFGTTNNIDSVYNPALRYTSNFIDLQARPSFYISKHWLAGANIRLRYENSTQSTEYRVQSTDDNSHLIPQHSLLTHNGFGENIFLGIGGAISYDTRSNNYYPLHGLFFKTTITYYQQFSLNSQQSTANSQQSTANSQTTPY
jgi:hypothetical protein